MPKSTSSKPKKFTKKYLFSLILITLLFSGGITIFNIENYKILALSSSEKKIKISLRDFIKNQENQIRRKKYKSYNFLDSKIQNSVENYIIGKTKFDKNFYNKLPNIPGSQIEQILEFQKQSSGNGELSLIINENRLTQYEDGQTGSEKIRYDLIWDIDKNEAISIDEYDNFGQKIDKNKITKNNSMEEDALQERAFYNKYNGNKKDIPKGEIDYRATIPKDFESQKKFFETKNNALLDSTIKTELQNNQFSYQNPLSINVRAGTSWDKNAAANYARSNAFEQFPLGYSNYEVNYQGGDCANYISQALIAGGLNKDYNYHDTNFKDWYFHWNNNQVGVESQRIASNTWIGASKNADHMYSMENTSPWYRIYPNNAAYILDIGDIIYINNWRGTYHVMMVTGATWRSDLGYWDALYSQHTDSYSNKSFTQGYNANSGDYFYGLKFYSQIW